MLALVYTNVFGIEKVLHNNSLSGHLLVLRLRVNDNSTRVTKVWTRLTPSSIMTKTRFGSREPGTATKLTVFCITILVVGYARQHFFKIYFWIGSSRVNNTVYP